MNRCKYRNKNVICGQARGSVHLSRHHICLHILNVSREGWHMVLQLLCIPEHWDWQTVVSSGRYERTIWDRGYGGENIYFFNIIYITFSAVLVFLKDTFGPLHVEFFSHINLLKNYDLKGNLTTNIVIEKKMVVLNHAFFSGKISQFNCVLPLCVSLRSAA